MGPPTTFADLKDWLSPDSQANSIVPIWDGRRRALVRDAAVQAATPVTEATGEAPEVHSLPPYPDDSDCRIAALSKTAQVTGPPCRVAAKLRGVPSADAKASVQAAESAHVETAPVVAQGLDGLDSSWWGECIGDEEHCKMHPHTTCLVEALGLAEPYTALRKRLQSSADFVEESLQQHRADVASARPPSSRSRPKVHSRDLAKLRGLLAKMSHLQRSMDDALLQRQVVASWEVPDALPLLAQEAPRRGGPKLRPQRKWWQSSSSSLGPFAQVTFRIYPAGDGDAVKGDSVIYFWAELAPRLSFAFSVQAETASFDVGGTEVIPCQTWYREVAWARAEFGWAMLASELTRAEALNCGRLPIRLKLLHWHSASTLAGSQLEQNYRDR
ncbi:unnamed protein product [Symbiodinium natans]|uniref:Uncharacterized protein n=1 Tax=Symbiodinium natans TaxID=878477 RepID=A0A812SPM6_9DINO|nr:unnamed protein product [Symbiodinium natans]